MTTPDKWVWMPHPAHFICGADCKFHLATYVGGFIVSTVGEYMPDSHVRKTMEDVSGPRPVRGTGSRAGKWETIGYDRLYETMVFKAQPAEESDTCCLWTTADGEDLDSEGYNEHGAAYRGHLSMCHKWAAKHEEAPADDDG